jgi:hypothetical protein
MKSRRQAYRNKLLPDATHIASHLKTFRMKSRRQAYRNQLELLPASMNASGSE